MRKVKLLIVDDHKMVRNGICSMLELYKDKFNFSIDLAETGLEAINRHRKNGYDIIIMDYQMPIVNGVTATEEIVSKDPNVKILAISNYDEYANITSMINAGAFGFILKNVDSEELILAITSLLNNKNYYSSEIAAKLVHNNPDIRGSKENINVLNSLSERELEILKLIILEYTNAKIAEKLKLSKRTIDKHRQRLLEKFKTNNTVGLVKKAIELNLFQA